MHLEAAPQPLVAQRIGIVAANHVEYVETLFSCLEAGEVAVPLRSVDDTYRINAANVAQILTPSGGGSWLTRSFRSANRDEIAVVSFTSGTEGAPKGVLLSHRNLGSVVDRLNALMQVDSSIREYVGVPVYHSFGFGRCRAVATAGGRSFIPSGGFNPAEISAMLKSGEINAISAVPSLWRVLLANSDAIGQLGRRVRWIEIGSQYMSREEKEALKQLFPEARIVQHYGLTEASRSTLLEIHSTSGAALESVGQAIGDVELKFDADGRIAIRGDHVARGYLINGKLVQLQDEAGWFVTKDLGRLENGHLYYKGRADDIINCGGIKVDPEALEAKVYAQIGHGHGLAICRRPDALRGEGFLVAVTPEIELDRTALRTAVIQATQEFGVNAANAIALVEVDQLPKTATGKIQRKQLSERYGIESAPAPTQTENTANFSKATIAPVFCRSLNLSQVKPEDTFISLGGDSLSFVQLSIELERTLGDLPKGWEHLSIAELEALTPQQHRYTTIETGIFLRALSICGVVAGHAGLSTMIAGGAVLLLLLAGSNFARFQSSALFENRFVQPILSLLRHLAVPYWMVAIPYELWKREFDLSIVLLIGNFFDTNSIFPIWFINNLVQIIIIFSLLFCVRSIRRFAATAPWAFGLVLVGVGGCTNLIGPLVWDTEYLLNRVPHILFWIFALGWTVQFATLRDQKIATTFLIGAIVPILSSAADSRTWWILIGATVLLWLPDILIPRIVKSPLQLLGAAAYYIYLTHMAFMHPFRNVWGIEDPWINTIVPLICGVGVWLGVQAIQQRFTKRNSAESMYEGSI